MIRALWDRLLLAFHDAMFEAFIRREDAAATAAKRDEAHLRNVVDGFVRDVEREDTQPFRLAPTDRLQDAFTADLSNIDRRVENRRLKRGSRLN